MKKSSLLAVILTITLGISHNSIAEEDFRPLFNGKVVAGGSKILPRKGYICLESEGAPVEFRNIRIKELPSTGATAKETATLAAE